MQPERQNQQARRGPPVYSVHELTGIIRARLEKLFPRVGVSGEVSNLSRPRSGHLYFSIKDRQACLRVVMFRSAARQLRFRLHDGLKVCAFGSIGVYPQRGDYQLLAERLEPEGLGALQLAFEQLKARLASEGLFDARRKQALPRFPRCIGVVTSPTGAALRDICSTLRRRWPLARLLLSPARVQGDGASHELAQALQMLDASGLCDVIIVGRGGGSLEDLWAFNEEPLVRAIFAACTPIVSAVGHEVDVTLSDGVADRRAVTPTAGAELVAPDVGTLRNELARREQQLRTGFLKELRRRRDRLGGLEKRLQGQQPERRLRERAQHLDQLAMRLERALGGALQQRHERLRMLARALWVSSPRARLSEGLRQLQESRRRLLTGMAGQLQRAHQRHRLAAVALEAKSPLGVLARGYSLATLESSGRIVTRPADAPPGSRVQLRLQEGSLRCRVLGTGPKQSGGRSGDPAHSPQATFGDWV